jgi:threonine dehydrogenase-like Zn-dependent dehydrogenase
VLSGGAAPRRGPGHRGRQRPERLTRASNRGVHIIDENETDDVAQAVRELTEGRGADAVIDAVGMEAHGSGLAQAAGQAVSLLPSSLSAPLMRRAGIDRLAAVQTAIDAVRRGGTLSLSGVYGGQTDPLPTMTLFDEQVQIRMGQANVKRWAPEILPLLTDADPLGVDTFATHHLPLEQAPDGYRAFQTKQDGTVKVVLHPWAAPGNYEEPH